MTSFVFTMTNFDEADFQMKDPTSCFQYGQQDASKQGQILFLERGTVKDFRHTRKRGKIAILVRVNRNGGVG